MVQAERVKKISYDLRELWWGLEQNPEKLWSFDYV